MHLPDQSQVRHAARRGSARTTGLLVAVGLMLAFALLVGWFWVFGKGAAAPSQPGNEPLTSRPPDIKDAPSLNLGGQASSPLGASKFGVTLADEADPTRVAWKITADKATPKEAGRYELVKPVVINLMPDGRTLRFTSDRGELFLPSEGKTGRPEAGHLDGNAHFDLFEAAIDRSAVLLSGSTDTIQFDGMLGEVRLPGRIAIRSPQVDYDGFDGVLQLNEARKELDSLHIDRSNLITIRPPAKTAPTRTAASVPVPAAPAPSAAAPSPAAPLANSPAAPAVAGSPKPSRAGPTVTYYHTTLTENIVVTQGERTIRADILELWTRLEDNRLPAGTVAMRSGRSQPPASPRASTPRPRVEADARPQLVLASMVQPSDEPPRRGPAAKLAPEDNSLPVVIRATGPLNITLVRQRPQELERDDLTMRFSSSGDRLVTLDDPKMKAKGSGSRLTYHATRRQIEIDGRGPRGTTISIDGGGSAVGQAFAMNLSTGVAKASGPGVLTGDTAGPAVTSRAARELRWDRDAEFRFAVVDGQATSRLIEATPRGSVVATDGTGEIRGQEIQAQFAANTSKPDQPLVSRLAVRGDATASDGRGGTLTADVIEAFFAQSGAGQSEPVRVRAEGRVSACSGPSQLVSQSLDAALDKDAKGRSVVVTATAEGAVAYRGANGVSASASRLVARPTTETVELSGRPATVAQGESNITGDQIRLAGGSGQGVTVFGPGELRYIATSTTEGSGVEADAATRGELTVIWSRQLTFDDASGSGECAGDVTAQWAADERSIDTIRGERLTLAFTPGASHAAPAPILAVPNPAPGEASASRLGSRRLLGAEVFGAIAERGDGPRAIIESKRYAENIRDDYVAQATTLPDVVVFLESDRIRLDNPEPIDAGTAITGVLSTPGAGKLLIRDHRADASDKPGTGTDSNSRAKGDALFAWTGPMRLDRASGNASMRDHVSLIHRRLGDGEITELKCEELTARIAEPAGKGRDASPRLSSVMASGNPELKVGTREIRASSIRYDAQQELVEALSLPNHDVIAIDRKAGTSSTASSVLWKLREQNWQIRGLRATTPN